MILEGAMIIIAAVALTVSHPHFAFSGQWADAGWSLRSGTSKRKITGMEMGLGSTVMSDGIGRLDDGMEKDDRRRSVVVA